MDYKDKIVVLVTGTLIKPWVNNWKECEQTWIPKLRELGYTVMVALGDESLDDYYKIDGNIIYFKAADTKMGLYDKSVRLPIKWILEETQYQYYFRIDSDSFVHPERFDKMMKENLEELSNLDYMGCCTPYRRWNPFIPHREWVNENDSFASGVGYFVSKRAMEIANKCMRIENDIEYQIDDWVLGRAMWENRIPLLHDSRILFESKHLILINDPMGVGVPDIADTTSHLAIQHYMNGHMVEAAKKLGWYSE